MVHKHAAKDSGDQVVLCGGCHLLIAARVAGLIVVRRGAFELVAEGVHSLRCHRCGTNNTLEPREIMAAENRPGTHYPSSANAATTKLSQSV